jgi:hypothetical protein
MIAASTKTARMLSLHSTGAVILVSETLSWILKLNFTRSDAIPSSLINLSSLSGAKKILGLKTCKFDVAGQHAFSRSMMLINKGFF